MKGLISIILSGAMLTTAFVGSSITASAEADAVEGFEITELDDGTVEIDKYVGGDRRVVIPSTLNGKTVTGIGSFAFHENRKIKSVTIPDTVTYIDGLAFDGCAKLADITIPDSVLRIGVSNFDETAYYNNEENWEDGALYIGNHLIDVEDSTEDIFNKVGNFKVDKYKRDEYKIKEGTVSISPLALTFNAKKLIIPASVKFIDDSALELIASEEISVASENKYYHSIDGVLFETASNTLLRYPIFKPEKEYIIPDNITKLGNYAFRHCTLDKLTIPESITALDNGAFSHCNLPTIAIPKSVEKIDEHTFSWCSDTEAIEVDSDNKHYYSVDGILFDKEANKILLYPPNKPVADYEIPDNITEVDLYAFRGSKLTSLTIPASVKSIITASAWYTDSDFCVGAINVDSDNKIYYSVDGVLFEKESNVLLKYPSGKSDTEYTVPDGVTAIGDYAFNDTNCQLVTITTPESVAEIRESAFKSCSELKTVNIMNPKCEISVTAIPHGVETPGFEVLTRREIVERAGLVDKAKPTESNKVTPLTTALTLLNRPAVKIALVAVLILMILLFAIIKRNGKKTPNTQITSDL